ncbi:putative Fyve zinc finger protein [Rosellinia necatrix]|uniref:RING-type E3 ubiquitin transferase n=1 Tax=Rosellinia necatrix TaxID=77044 RepID=A0A1S7UJZ7_ROSNE|nr:putative Fyve zinc finger protein [Rosellinia necatrix]
MSASPEDNVQTGDSAGPPGQPVLVNGIHIAETSTVSPNAADEDESEDRPVDGAQNAAGESTSNEEHPVNGNTRGNEVSSQTEQESPGYNVIDAESGESDIKHVAPWLPATLHQNSPATPGTPGSPAGPSHVRDGAAPGAVSTNGLPEPSVSSVTAPETPGNPGNHEATENPETAEGPEAAENAETHGQQDSGSQVDGVGGVHGQYNSAPPNEPSTHTSNSSDTPTSQHSPAPTGPPPPHPTDYEDLTSQGGNRGDSGSPFQVSMPPDESSDSTSNPSPELDPQIAPGQDSSSGQADEPENQGNESPRRDTAGLGGPVGSPNLEEGNLHGQQTSHNVPGPNEASDRGDTAVVIASLNVSQAGFPPQHREASHSTSGSIFQSFSSPGPSLPAPRRLGSGSTMNPIAPSFIPRPGQSGAHPEFTLPRWQPDAEVTHCPICDTQFGMFLRRHHCRKCGRVVCDRCSPHRITIPHPYIVRPPGDRGPAAQYSYPGVEGSIADFNSVGGGERVRLCNPCVPDPNTAPPPPRPQPSSQPLVVDGRSQRARLASYSSGNHGINPTPYPPTQHHNPSRSRSASTSAGPDQQYLSFIPYNSTSRQYSNSTDFQPLPHRRAASSGLRYTSQIEHFGRARGSSSSSPFSGLNRPLPRTPTPEREVPEEDTCPVCHGELPSRTLVNYEVLREIHINNCITSHSNYGSSQPAGAARLESHGTPPPRTTRRTRMFPYVATEKDCVGDVECTICLEEFKVGEEMARLECFCRFHRSCIDSWFVNHPGRCPIHQHDSFGY